MAPQLSPFTRTSDVTIPRQLAPTVGPAHGGFEFLKGNFEGLKGYVVGRMTKSRRGKIYIDDEGWGPDAGSIEYGYRVPFGGIQVFIGRIGEPGPEPDNCTDLVETAQRARKTRTHPVMKRAFVGCIHGEELSEGSGDRGETAVLSDGDSSARSTDLLYQVQDGVLGGCSDGISIPDPCEPPRWARVFMAGTQPSSNSTATTAVTSGLGAAGAGGPVRPSA